MGGYMGFGLQRWIYSRTPKKKLYEVRRLESFTSLPKYSRKFTLKPSIEENKILIGIIAITIAIGLSLSFFLFYKTFTNYSKTYSNEVKLFKESQDLKAFNYLRASGINRLKRNMYEDAYSEFQLAYAINPNDNILNQLLSETLLILCDNDTNYCYELNAFLMK